MRIKILVNAPYSDFDSDPPGRAIIRQAGDVVDYPDWYARGLVQAGLAEVVGDLPPELTQPAPVEIKVSEHKGRRKR